MRLIFDYSPDPKLMNAMPNNTDKNSSRLSGEYFVAAGS
jgi:hypothetical protein